MKARRESQRQRYIDDIASLNRAKIAVCVADSPVVRNLVEVYERAAKTVADEAKRMGVNL